MNKRIRGNLLLLLTALIWGVAFVAQKDSMDYIGPFTFNFTRMALAGVALLAIVGVTARRKPGPPAGAPDEALQRRMTWLGGFFCGLMLFVGSALQQFGVKYTTAGKAGFITALYIVLVPIFGLFLRKRVGKMVWAGVALAVGGLYLLCIQSGLSLGLGDGLVMLSAAGFALHILVVDHFSPRADGIKMSCIQFFVCGGLNLVCMLIFESPTLASIGAAWLPILYAGLLSSGMGYTLQILAQRDTDPTVASLIMSLESVFAVLAGGWLLGEVLSAREIWGCVLMAAAIVLAQLPEGKPSHKAE